MLARNVAVVCGGAGEKFDLIRRFLTKDLRTPLGSG